MSDEWHDFRGYAGRVAGGVFKPGDAVTVLPSGFTTRVKAIHSPDGELLEAFAPQSVCFTLTDEIDISAATPWSKPTTPPHVSQDIEAMICWFSPRPMPPRAKLLVRHTTLETKAIIQEVKYHVDINTLHKIDGVEGFNMNDIGRISLRTAVPLIHDSYRRNRSWRIKPKISRSSIIYSAWSMRNTNCTSKGNFLKPIVSGSSQSRSNWISAGTSCASGVPCATSGTTRTKRRFALRRSSKITSSRNSSSASYTRASECRSARARSPIFATDEELLIAMVGIQARQTRQAYLRKRAGGEVIGSETWCPFLPDFRQQSDLHEHR